MDLARPQVLQPGQMIWGRVAFVFGKVVAWICRVRPFHQAVAENLGYVGRSGNGIASLVAFDQGFKGKITLSERHIVQQQVVWRHRQTSNSAQHGLYSSPSDAHPVYFIVANYANATVECILLN